MGYLYDSMESLLNLIRFPHKKGLRNLLEEIDTAIDVAVPDIFIAEFEVAPDQLAANNIVSTNLTEAAIPVFDMDDVTQPDVCRCLSVKGTKAGATLTGNVVVTGTDYNDEAISETFALNGDSTITGTKAFKSITNVALPGWVTDGDNVVIGVTDKIGMPHKMDGNNILHLLVDGVKEAPAAVTFSSTVLAQNTFDGTTASNGTRVFKAVYLRKIVLPAP